MYLISAFKILYTPYREKMLEGKFFFNQFVSLQVKVLFIKVCLKIICGFTTFSTKEHIVRASPLFSDQTYFGVNGGLWFFVDYYSWTSLLTTNYCPCNYKYAFLNFTIRHKNKTNKHYSVIVV